MAEHTGPQDDPSRSASSDSGKSRDSESATSETSEQPEQSTEPVESTPPDPGRQRSVKPHALQVAASMLADGLLAGLLCVLSIRSLLPARPLSLPTGASDLGVVLLGTFAFCGGIVLSVRGSLVERGSRWQVDGLLLAGTSSIAALVVLPMLGVGLPATTLVLGVLGLGLLAGAPVLVGADTGWLGRRAGAACVDGVLSVGLWYSLLFVLPPAVGAPAPTGGSWGELLGALLLLSGCSGVVRLPLEAYDGRSIGKRLAGLRVVDETGDSPTLGAAVLRNLCRPVDALPVGYLFGVTLLAAVGTDRRLGDVVAGTRVERVR